LILERGDLDNGTSDPDLLASIIEWGQCHYLNQAAVIQTYQARIYITLRPSVLDPAGTAVQSGLKHMGYDNVEQVRIGKYVELVLQAPDESAARDQLDRICDQLLANPVIENYRFELATLAVSG
jgi:phosphoribosylformylglycinamidine synthase